MVAIQVRSTILDVLFIYTLQAKLMMLYSGYALASLALQCDRFHQILSRKFSTQNIKMALFISNLGGWKLRMLKLQRFKRLTKMLISSGRCSNFKNDFFENLILAGLEASEVRMSLSMSWRSKFIYIYNF